MNKIDLEGIYIPLITPFSKDSTSELDLELLKELASFYIKEYDLSGIVPCGTTGESPTLKHEEFEKIIQSIKEVTKEEYPIIAGSGTNSTTSTIELTKRVQDAGADASLLVTPYYNKPNQHQLIRHIENVANSVKIPIILYDIPGRTGVSISLDSYKEIIQIDNVIGVKIAPNNFSDVNNLLTYINNNQINDFSVLAGEDNLTFSMICLGAKGGITAAAHIIGKEYAEMYKLIKNGEIEKARKIHSTTYNIVNLMFEEPNPGPIKYALQLMGYNCNSLRQPLDVISEGLQLKIKNELQKLNKI